MIEVTPNFPARQEPESFTITLDPKLAAAVMRLVGLGYNDLNGGTEHPIWPSLIAIQMSGLTRHMRNAGVRL